MSQKIKLIEGLKNLNELVKSLTIDLQNESSSIGETIEYLSLVAPIETTINKAIKKASETRIIPKQSAVKQTRS